MGTRVTCKIRRGKKRNISRRKCKHFLGNFSKKREDCVGRQAVLLIQGQRNIILIDKLITTEHLAEEA